MSASTHRKHVWTLGMLLLSVWTVGRTIIVDQEGQGDYTSIQAALNSVVGGDIVVVKPGLYRENIKIDFDGSISTPVTLTSDRENPNRVKDTIIDGQPDPNTVSSNGPVVEILQINHPNCRFILDGFTIQNGVTEYDVNGQMGIGGGIYGRSMPIDIYNCTIRNNYASQGGGGLAGIDGEIHNCTITNNYTSYYYDSFYTAGGGAVIGGVGGYYSGAIPKLFGCVVLNNESWLGGGLRGCDATNCLIEGNSAIKGGGGIDCFLYNCVVRNNSANEGGGIAAGFTDQCQITANTAFTCGGGAYDYMGLNVTNSIISGNTALVSGGGVYSPSCPHLSNCTITGNKAETGAGLSISSPAGDYKAVNNCIVWYNKLFSGLPNNLEGDENWVEYSCFPGASINCNISSAPDFVSQGVWVDSSTWLDGDYHLLNTSPCIDRGKPVISTEDFEKNPRNVDYTMAGPNSATADVGAYETQDGPAVTLITHNGMNHVYSTLFGILNNGIHYTTGGHTRTCLQLDGIDDFLDIPDSNGIGGTSSRLCSAWIKTKDNNYGNIVTWGLNETGRKWMFRVQNTGQLAVGIWGGYIMGQTVVNDGNWHHVAAVLSGDTDNDGYIRLNDIVLYVDGVKEETVCSGYSGDLPLIDTALTQSIKIGVRCDDTFYDHFSGKIDDIKIYSTSALPEFPEDEIKVLAGPRCHWKLDETAGTYAYDSTNNGYTGHLKNFFDSDDIPGYVSEKWVEGAVGQALKFDGIDDHVTFSNGIIDPNATAFSAFAWVKLSEKKGTDCQIILQQCDEGSNRPGRSWLWRSSDDKLCSSIGGSGTASTTAVFATVGEWHHVGLTYDGSILRLYVDGQLNGSASRNAESCTGKFYLGQFKWDGYSETYANWAGCIDDVRIYDRALKTEEIKVLSSSTVAYWKLDDNEGFFATDTSECFNHARLECYYATFPQWVNSYSHSALLFSADGDYAKALTFTGVHNDRSRTCSAWIKTTCASGTILSWGQAVQGQKWSFRVGSTGKLEVGIWDGYIRGNTTVNDGQWHRVTVVLNSDGFPTLDEIELYVDGIQQTTTLANFSGYPPHINTSDSEKVTLGVHCDEGSYLFYFSGTIDDVRIYERALTPLQVQTMDN